jgi:sterol desaturase/sphingolipid hydroxylase (fatty acid hydroxylase superfamily)
VKFSLVESPQFCLIKNKNKFNHIKIQMKMGNVISTLEQGIPLIIVISLTVFMTLESFIPFLEMGAYRKKQRWQNILNLVVSFILNALLSGVISYSLTVATENHFGLMPMLHIPPLLALVLGVFLSDLNGYVAHRLYHKSPLFWRFHRVHHSDIALDASTALRLHPFEFLFQATTQATILPLLGVSNTSFVIYAAISLPLFIINHANLKYPNWYERYVCLVFVTPNWHRVHHSSFQAETDSNFADVFTLWDRLFATHKTKNPEDIQYGLETQRDPKSQSFWGLMMTPFKSFDR